MQIKNLSTVNLDSILNVPAGADSPSPTSALEIEVGDNWIPAESQLWRAWTGRRTVWGMEYHGPVYVMGAKEETLFTGKRICPCAECQKSVVPEFKYN